MTIKINAPNSKSAGVISISNSASLPDKKAFKNDINFFITLYLKQRNRRRRPRLVLSENNPTYYFLHRFSPDRQSEAKALCFD